MSSNMPDDSLPSFHHIQMQDNPPPPLHPVRPPPKRSRKAVNCEPCRASKLKCDRARPCSSCVLRGTAALCYQGDPRGADHADHRHSDDPSNRVDPRQEIARIRQALSLLESHINRHSSWLSSSSHHHSSPPLEHSPRGFKQESIDHTLGPKSSTDFAPAMLAQPRTGDGGMYAGPTSAATHLATVKAESDITDDDDDRSVVSDMPSSESSRDFDLLAMLPEISIVDGLIKHYFESCQWENRHLHHDAFMHAWGRYKANIANDRLVLATVFVVLAISVQFLPASHHLLQSFNDPPAELSENFYTLGCTVLTRYHAERRTYSLELIELLLLRTHYLTITKDQCEDLWTIRGELVSTAIAMGLHRDPGRWKMSRDVAERRRWAWWNIMLIERWQAFMFGRPLAICNHHFDTQFPGQFDPMYDPTGRLHLPHLHLFRLAESMGDIMDDAVSVRPVPYERVIAQDQVLARWLDSLPPELNLDDYRLARALSSKELPIRRTGAQSLCIRIFYYHVRFTLHRPYAGPWKPSPSSSTILHQPPDPRWQQSLETAISAADRLTQLVTQARPDFLANDNLAVPGHLHWGPFHIFSAAMFFSFQLIANPDQPGANLFRANIKRVMVVLEHLRGIHVADKAYSVLEALAPLYDEVGPCMEDRDERERKKGRVLSFVRRLAFPCHDSPAFTRVRVQGGAAGGSSEPQNHHVVANGPGAVVHHGPGHAMMNGSGHGHSGLIGSMGHGASPNGSTGTMSSPVNMPVTPIVGAVVLPPTSVAQPPPPPPTSSQNQGAPSSSQSNGSAYQTMSATQSRHSYEHAPPPPPPASHTSHPHSHTAHPHVHTHPTFTDETVWGTSIGLDSGEWASFVNVVQPRGTAMVEMHSLPPGHPGMHSSGAVVQHGVHQPHPGMHVSHSGREGVSLV